MLKQKLLYIILILWLISNASVSQAQNWPKIYGDNFHSQVRDLTETYDRGYIITGYTYDVTVWPEYVWIIKTDINGEILWDKWFGDGDYSNGVTSSKMTDDRGIILAAGSSKYSGNYDPTFIKMDVCGEIEWCRVLLSPDQNYATGIIQLLDGSYIGMLQYYGEGAEYARISLIKMDQTGEPMWIQRLAQEDSLIYNEEGGFLYLTKDQNYLISGECFYPGLNPFWIKADSTGNQIWDLKWQGGTGGAYQVTEGDNDYFYSAGGFAGAGYAMTPSIFKFDNEGNPLCQSYLLGDTLVGGGADPIIFYNDSVLITGIHWRTSINVDDGYSEVLMTDTVGDIQVRRILLHENKPPKAIITSYDNKILVTGNYVVDENWDIYLWKMNQDLVDDSLYTQPMTYDSLCPYPISSDTIDLDCNLFVNIDEIPTKEEYEYTIKISPNPASEWISTTFPENLAAGKVELFIYDLFGRQVLSEKVYPENRLVSLNVSDLPSGVYLIKGHDSRNQAMKGKFVISR